ncbi:MAG: hypothetical protein ABIQ88_11330 [Chitinophagaceae bacterium]
METTLDKFRAKLVIKILCARSAAEPARFIKAAVRSMEKNKVTHETITHFVDRVLNQLNIFKLSDTSPLKWNNIQAATSSLLQARQMILQ